MLERLFGKLTQKKSTVETPIKKGIQVLAIAGSLRQDSVNKKLLRQAVKIALELDACVQVADLKEYPLPLYDGDLEANEGIPAKAMELREKVLAAQVIFIASPEYNASVSAVLKNSLDWMSRADSGKAKVTFKDKLFVLMSASPSPRGGARGLVHLRAILQGLGASPLEDQLTVADAYQAFDEVENLKNEALAQALRKLIQTALSKG